MRYSTIVDNRGTTVLATETDGGEVPQAAIPRRHLGSACRHDRGEGSRRPLRRRGDPCSGPDRPAGSTPRRRHFSCSTPQRLRVRERIDLPGFVSFDAISPDGRLLYLVTYDSATNPFDYSVRVYDVEAGEYKAGEIVDPSEPDEEMAGQPVAREMSPDGRWAYTLYGGGEEAFIHALDTEGETAVCVDLENIPPGDAYRHGLAVAAGTGAISVMRGGEPVATVDPESFEVTSVTEEVVPGPPEDDGGQRLATGSCPRRRGARGNRAARGAAAPAAGERGGARRHIRRRAVDGGRESASGRPSQFRERARARRPRATMGPADERRGAGERAPPGPRRARPGPAGAREPSSARRKTAPRRHWRSSFAAIGAEPTAPPSSSSHDATAAEDIAQEAFLAAIRSLDRFDRRRPFGPWLHRIAVNRAIDCDARAKARRRGRRSLRARRRVAGPPSIRRRALGRPARGAGRARARAARGGRPALPARLHARRDRARCSGMPRGTVNSRLRRGARPPPAARRRGMRRMTERRARGSLRELRVPGRGRRGGARAGSVVRSRLRASEQPARRAPTARARLIAAGGLRRSQSPVLALTPAGAEFGTVVDAIGRRRRRRRRGARPLPAAGRVARRLERGPGSSTTTARSAGSATTSRRPSPPHGLFVGVDRRPAARAP